MKIKRLPPSSPVLDHRVFPRGRIAECIVLPTTQELLVGTVPRNVMPTALLRLRSGMVLMLRAVGHAWTDGRLARVAAALARQSVGSQGLVELRKTLVDELGMPSLVTLERVNLRPSPDQWPFAALSAVASGHPNSGVGRGAALRRPNTELESAVGAALEGFADALDPRAASLATKDGMLDVAAYNYFAHRLHGRYRRQFAATFPLLANTVINPGVGKEEMSIRRAIDAGRPAITEIARSWGVAPRVARHMIGKPSELVGTKWAGRLSELARILNQLPPECLPGDVQGEWDHFNDAVARVRRLNRQQLGDSWAALAVLREELVGPTRQAKDPARVEARGTRLAACVQAFEDSLALALEVETERQGIRASQEVDSAIEQVVNAQMAGLLRKGALSRVAWTFEQGRTKESAELDNERKLIAGTLFWPLFPGPFVSGDGARKVISLQRDRQFLEVAGALANCLWAQEGYRRSARQGTASVLAILEGKTGIPRSTAYVVHSRDKVRRRWTFKVMGHLALLNLPPSNECVNALTEALRHCERPEVQAHLDQGAHLREARDREGSRRASRQWEVSLLAPALRAALGGGRFERLVERVRDLLGVAVS